VHEIISFILACAGAQENKNTARKAGRKEEKSQCILHVCVERPLVGGFQPNMAKCVRFTDAIKRAKFHRYNNERFQSCEVLKFYVAIWNPGLGGWTPLCR